MNYSERDLAEMGKVMLRHQQLMMRDPFLAAQLTEEAGKFAMQQTGCSKADVNRALESDPGSATEEEVTIFNHFTAYLIEAHRQL